MVCAGEVASATPQPLSCRQVDLDVDERHDRERDEEGAGSTVQHEAAFVGQLTRVRLAVVQTPAAAVVPAEHGRH